MNDLVPKPAPQDSNRASRGPVRDPLAYIPGPAMITGSFGERPVVHEGTDALARAWRVEQQRHAINAGHY